MTESIHHTNSRTWTGYSILIMEFHILEDATDPGYIGQIPVPHRAGAAN